MTHEFNLNEDGELRGFTWLDYTMFIGMLVSSLAIGIFYALKDKQQATEEFLLGGRTLTCAPVAMSLVASYISAILVLGGPAETYYHSVGWWVGVGSDITTPLVAFVIMPFFYKLRITSVYEYLEMRYDSKWVRRLASGIFVIQTLLYEAVAIYAPAIALSAVNNIPIWISIICVAVIASVYTAIGGMKAVIWTDVLQLGFILVGLVAIVVKGSLDVGGMDTIWQVALEHNRTGTGIMNLGFSLYERHTVTNIMLGSCLGSIQGLSFSQTSVQRYASMKSLGHARMALFLTMPFFIGLYSLATLTGLVLFATYEGCDPLAAGLIDKKDQILPFFVMDRLSVVSGLPGLFLACIFSGALSTISSAVSAQAAVTWEDFLCQLHCCAALPPATQATVTRFIALGYGALAVGLSFLAGNLQGLLQTAGALVGSISGPLLAVFVMALFMPFSNSKGACLSLLVGISVPFVINMGASVWGLGAPLLPTSTDSCPIGLVIPEPSSPPITAADLDYPEKFFGISYTHIITLGFIVSMTTGIIVSVVTGGNSGRCVKRSLVHPWVRWTLEEEGKVTARVHKHSHTNTAMVENIESESTKL